MHNNIWQYKFIFILSWVLFYLIFPTWALPISVTARAAVFFGLIVFFSISASIMNHWFSAIFVNKPAIIIPQNVPTHFKNNSGLFIICCLTGILHIYPLSFPILIIGDEALHLQSGLWIYEHIDVSWHRLFQIAFWALIVLILLKRKANKTDNLYKTMYEYISGLTAIRSKRILFIFLFLLIPVAYFLLLRNITFNPEFIHYPHLVKFIYHIAYCAFGMTPVGPRIIQLILYISSAVYLYRTILLIANKETALTGATIFLFLPVLFTYAKLAEISCGTLYFIMLISFHFLRFIKQEDNRDLLLASFFIGLGFMYRQEIFLMFFICTIYLLARSIISQDLNLKNHLKVMLISLVSIIPWMIISKFFSWRNYKIIWSNFKPFEGKVFSFFLHMPLDISWILFVLFMFSVVFILIFKRNPISLFFGLLFLSYYFFLALDIANYSPRLAMSYYPAISVYLSLFLCSIIDTVRWKHTFKMIYMIIAIYMISICTVPSLNAQFLSSFEFRKLKYFPSEDAMRWVKENVKEGEKILTLRIMSADFYRLKYEIDNNRIVSFRYEIKNANTADKLMAFIREHKITYIMFPYNFAYIRQMRPDLDISEYIKSNLDKEFMEIATYNNDENYIYIVKLKDPAI